MKRILKLTLTTVLLLILCSCESGNLMDVNIFSERFNEISETKINTAELTVCEIPDGTKEYRIFTASDILITLEANINSDITRCDITIDAGEDDIADDRYREFLRTVEYAAHAYTKEGAEYISVIMTKLDLISNENPPCGIVYHDTLAFEYCRISDENGISVSIKNNSLNPEISETPSLRKNIQ